MLCATNFHFMISFFVFCFLCATDLGKVLLLPSFGALPQWAVVGEQKLSYDQKLLYYLRFNI